MKNEIEIPDGCEAKIVGNKVVFVPKDSEDEIHRKWILEYLYDGLRKADEQFKDQFKAAIDWLERQKEYIDDIRQYAYNKGLVDAEEKQKPLSTEETELNSIAFLEQLGYICIPTGAKQKPAEWSDEDERVIHDAHCWLDEYAGFLVSANKDKAKMLWKLSEKLKSLRPQPQRRDTYYDIIHDILATLKDMDFMKITPEHRVSLLNDIRVKCKNADECAAILDEPHWKPGEEHFQGLRRAIIKAEKGSDAWNSLTDLYEHLKNL